MPRYSSTRDVDVDLSLKNLSRKLVMLMALVDASRTSELRALDIKFRTYKPHF